MMVAEVRKRDSSVAKASRPGLMLVDSRIHKFVWLQFPGSNTLGVAVGLAPVVLRTGSARVIRLSGDG